MQWDDTNRNTRAPFHAVELEGSCTLISSPTDIPSKVEFSAKERIHHFWVQFKSVFVHWGRLSGSACHSHTNMIARGASERIHSQHGSMTYLKIQSPSICQSYPQAQVDVTAGWGRLLRTRGLDSIIIPQHQMIDAGWSHFAPTHK